MRAPAPDADPPPAAEAEKKPPPAKPISPYAVHDTGQMVVDHGGETVSLRRRTPAERERYRRRMNLMFALAGLVVLVIVVAVLLQVRP